MSAVDKFMPLLSEAEDENIAPPPCISHEGVNVLIKHLSGMVVDFSIFIFDIVIFISSLSQNETQMLSKSSFFFIK